MIFRTLILATGMLATAALITPVQAATKEPGQLRTTRDCPAVTSLKKGTNPGDVHLLADRDYKVLGRNKPEGKYLLVKVPGAVPLQRWVSADCGDMRIVGEPSPESKSPLLLGGPQYVLALSWQPAFCQLNADRSECRGQDANRSDARQLSLHGLWPDKVDYCGASADLENAAWRDLPEPKLSGGLRDSLAQAMPGMASGLHKHEWHKHGSCYSDSAEEYFAESLLLLEQVNESLVGELFAKNIGREISAWDVRRAVTKAFGNGTGQRVSITCKMDGGRRIIEEVRLSLRGEITPETQISDLMKAAFPIPNKCSRGVVDAAGL
jgi:ribonuclease T2